MTSDPQDKPSGENDPSGAPTGDTPQEVTFSYERSRFCRVIHADGAWGGLTAQGNVYMALYSEHQQLPERATYQIDRESGRLSDQIHQVREGFAREVEVEVILSQAAAVALRNWLTERIELIEMARVKSPKREEGS